MGVKDLWTILEPVKRPVGLHELRGQTIAVDLSIWIVEVKALQLKGVTKPHLRNLFFRVSSLLQMDVIPVIVVEGVPPDLKQEVMHKRLAAQAHKDCYNSTIASKKLTRKNFSAVNRECCELLDYLGIPFIQSAGEAEAMCAFLNRNHIVDGCITNDGDAFLYGATTVYRNFTINSKDPHVETYRMEDIFQRLKLNRERLVGLAVLLGCDYLPKGVAGVGREQVMKLIATLDDKESLLKRFDLWMNVFDREKIGSVGNKSVEWVIQKKALATEGFPFKEVVNEFLRDRDQVPRTAIVWKRPKLFHAVNFTRLKMEWADAYAVEKIIPLMTRYDMLHHNGTSSKHGLQPHRIVKSRIKQGVSCFEIEWHKIDVDGITIGNYYVTIEEQQMFTDAFPDVVGVFQQNLQKKKPSRSRKKEGTGINSIPHTVSIAGVEPDDFNLLVRSVVKKKSSPRRRSNSFSTYHALSHQQKLAAFDDDPVFVCSSNESLPDVKCFLMSSSVRHTGSEFSHASWIGQGSQPKMKDSRLASDERLSEDVLPLFQRLTMKESSVHDYGLPDVMASKDTACMKISSVVQVGYGREEQRQFRSCSNSDCEVIDQESPACLGSSVEYSRNYNDGKGHSTAGLGCNVEKDEAGPIHSDTCCSENLENKRRAHSGSSNVECSVKNGAEVRGHSSCSVGGKGKGRRQKLKKRIAEILCHDVSGLSVEQSVIGEGSQGHEHSTSDVDSIVPRDEASTISFEVHCGVKIENERRAHSSSDMYDRVYNEMEVRAHSSSDVDSRFKNDMQVQAHCNYSVGSKVKRRHRKLNKRIAEILGEDVFDEESTKENDKLTTLVSNCNETGSRPNLCSDTTSSILTCRNQQVNKMENLHESPAPLMSKSHLTPWSAKHMGHFILETSILDNNATYAEVDLSADDWCSSHLTNDGLATDGRHTLCIGSLDEELELHKDITPEPYLLPLAERLRRFDETSQNK